MNKNDARIRHVCIFLDIGIINIFIPHFYSINHIIMNSLDVNAGTDHDHLPAVPQVLCPQALVSSENPGQSPLWQVRVLD